MDFFAANVNYVQTPHNPFDSLGVKVALHILSASPLLLYSFRVLL